jgi:multiple sugar transport system ATP-binding protein
VAGFIGSPAMNLVRGSIKAGVPPRIIAEGGAALPLPRAPEGSDNRPAIYGIRPEHFRLDPNGLPAEVVVVEPTGSETLVVVKIEGQEFVCVFRERIGARPGERMPISPDPNLVHLFDAETGKRLMP